MRIRFTLSACALLCVFATHSALAHLIPQQMGSVRLVEGKAYVVMAIPSTVLFSTPYLTGKAVELDTFEAQQQKASDTVRVGITIQCADNPMALLDLRLQPEIHYENAGPAVPQVTAMLIFSMPQPRCRMRFSTSLFHADDRELSYQLRVTLEDAISSEHVLTQQNPFFELGS
jgi:hypothetical protein